MKADLTKLNRLVIKLKDGSTMYLNVEAEMLETTGTGKNAKSKLTIKQI